MSVIIGSARIDENGHAHSGTAGDQKQNGTPDYRGEVSMQSFYVHSKGWYIYRAKNADHAEKLAECMKRACNNANIGYDQWQRDNIIKDHTDSKKKTECDCSSLVRECIIEATGKDPGNIRTVDMPYMLPRTGLFEDQISYTSGTTLYTGDILVTKTSGHTVIVVDGKARKKAKLRAAKPTLKEGDKGSEVEMLQRDFNKLGFSGKDRKKLAVDGDFGPNTDYACRNFQKTHDYTKDEPLEVDGIYGKKTHSAMKATLK